MAVKWLPLWPTQQLRVLSSIGKYFACVVIISGFARKIPQFTQACGKIYKIHSGFLLAFATKRIIANIARTPPASYTDALCKLAFFSGSFLHLHICIFVTISLCRGEVPLCVCLSVPIVSPLKCVLI